MKIIYKLANLIAFTSLFMLMEGCAKEPTSVDSSGIPSNVKCVPTKLPSLIKSINLNDPNASAGSVPLVAVFKFAQDLETYEDPKCKTLKPNCSVMLNVQNATAKKVYFDYTVTYVAGGNTWEYQDYLILEPNKSEDIGVIAKNCGWINGGSNITVTTNNIIYQ
jgi:hypothetical protein